TSSENFAPSISGASRRTRYTSSRSLTVVPAISKIASLNIVSFFQIYLTNCFAQPHGQHFNREHHAHHNDEDVGYDVELINARGIEQLEANASGAHHAQ